MLIKGVIIVLGLYCCQLQAQQSITLQLKWTHQFQFAGYYMAKHKGFYKAAGLDVNILAASHPTGLDSFVAVAQGDAQFGIAHSGILQQRLAGQPFVAMAAILQFSPYCWMVKQSSDIFYVSDFVGKRVTTVNKQNNTELLMMLKRSGININSLALYNGDEPIRAWIDDEVDALAVYVTGLPYDIAQQGIAYRLICPQRNGMDMYADILFTSENMLNTQPQIVDKFYLASLKGWRYAIANMDEAIRITQQYYAPHKSAHQLAYEAEILKNYIKVPGTPLGNMSIAKWRLIADIYGIRQSEFDNLKADFIYQHSFVEERQLSWMLIAALMLSIIAIPLYLRLMLVKNNRLEDDG